MCAAVVTYVSRKLSKIRWRPVPKSNLFHERANVFAVGSCDEQRNVVSVWNYPDTASATDEEEDPMNKVPSDPEMLVEVDHKGDVTDLKFCSHDLLVSASSNGSVTIYKYHGQNLQVSHTWDKVHEYPTRGAPCTAVDSKSDEICSVGEDGKLAVLNIHKKQLLQQKQIESCSLSDICYVRQQEVAVSNIRGQIRVFDLRTKVHKASLTVSHSGDQCGISCLGQHPSQAHLLVSGSEDGSLGLWDLRQERSFVAMLSTHQGAVMEAKFHPTNPDLLFTCSLDGSVLQWDASKVAQQNAAHHSTSIKSLRGLGLENQKPLYTGSGNPWLNCEAIKHKLDIVSLLAPLTVPVVSLDVEDEKLLCCAHNEAIYSVSGIVT